MTRALSEAAAARRLEILSLTYFYGSMHEFLGKNRPAKDLSTVISTSCQFFPAFVCISRMCHREYTHSRKVSFFFLCILFLLSSLPFPLPLSLFITYK